MAKLKIEINDVQNIRDILQNAYNLADEQIVQSQNEINKLSNATNLVDETLESRAKYAKAINDYLGMKDKAIGKKLDIAKILTEIQRYNGDVKTALESNGTQGSMDFDFESIKKMVDDTYKDKEETKTIEIKE
jgi:conjugal transfer/entry exclusion protein